MTLLQLCWLYLAILCCPVVFLQGDDMLQIAKLPKENESKPRTVVITQGADATIVAKDGKVQPFPERFRVHALEAYSLL